MEENTTISKVSIEDYNSICNAVMDYILSFKNSDDAICRNFILKREHTHNVVGYAEVISRSLELEHETILVAQLTALLHDIGRFRQFEEYQTFNDAESINHAVLGVKIIEENKWLSVLSSDIQEIIREVVLLHNQIEVPKTTPENIALIAKIIRDADKIDILDLSTKDYTAPAKDRNNAITLGLEESSKVSKAVVKSLMAGKLPNRKDLTTVTEFKLMQMAFVFDLNFRESFAVINKKGYVKKIFDTLPKSDQVFEIYRKIRIFIENNLL